MINDEISDNMRLHGVLTKEKYVKHLSVDCTIFSVQDARLKVLLLNWQDVEYWSLPGGFVKEDEDLDEAARRILYERTYLDNIFLEQFHTFGKVDRTSLKLSKDFLKARNLTFPDDHWLFERFISAGYCSLVDYTQISVFPRYNNESGKWFDLDKLPKLAFDHKEIVKKGSEYIRKNIDTQIAASNLLPEKFTMNELQSVYEAVLGENFRRNNFQRKILAMNFLERLEKLYDGSANKAPYLYRFRDVR
ncbi:NUDIX hydrolase [Kaistella pullorum]|uniref:NUDIX hydrolase n=1 Tax=Kaistella pullorum TaxID=2763074 RepID=A0ABR8WNG5_9FLAO|nr:NUDIX domain-containing protein [Kaistella pullorum]MBD8018216.1 NUDIX hydrolase [Kaistella pullorum]